MGVSQAQARFEIHFLIRDVSMDIPGATAGLKMNYPDTKFSTVLNCSIGVTLIKKKKN